MRSADGVAEYLRNVPLAPLTTLGVGGAAQWFVRAESAETVARAHAWAEARGLPVFVLGGGSNVVVADGGVRGLVVQVAIRGVRVRADGESAEVEAGAGEPWDGVVARVVADGYAGLETLSGIPGFTGGTPIQNVGAYGQEVSSSVDAITAFDTVGRELTEIPGRDCGFSYRQSRFKQQDAGRFTICAVRFRVRLGAPTVTYPDVIAWVERSRLRRPSVGDIRAAVLEIRRRKGMVLDDSDTDTRSVGSFFMNPVVPVGVPAALGAPSFSVSASLAKIPAAWLIEQAGFHKGYAARSVGVSSKHPLAIVNRGGASSSDVVDLAVRIKSRVLERFAIALRPEPVFVGFEADDRVQFLQGDVS